jgi:uncharacterized protein YaaQ
MRGICRARSFIGRTWTPGENARHDAALRRRSCVRAAYTPPVRLVVAIVHNEDAGALVDALLDRDFRATRLHSSGGFLKQSNVNPMPPIMEPGEFFMPYPLEVEVGGATVFVLPVERFERI